MVLRSNLRVMYDFREIALCSNLRVMYGCREIALCSNVRVMYGCREIALEILSQQEIGAFVVRDSTTHPNCYALSVKVPRFDNPAGISHYLIMRTGRGVKLKVSTIAKLLSTVVHVARRT